MYLYMHACMHACIHTYVYTYMHTYTHTQVAKARERRSKGEIHHQATESEEGERELKGGGDEEEEERERIERRSRDQEFMQRKLGLRRGDEGRGVTVLVVGGGDGMGDMVGVAKAVVECFCDFLAAGSIPQKVLRAIVVCDTNHVA